MVEISQREWEEVKGRLAVAEETAEASKTLLNRLLTEGGLEDSLTGHGFQQFGDGDYLAENLIHFTAESSVSNIEWEATGADPRLDILSYIAPSPHPPFGMWVARASSTADPNDFGEILVSHAGASPSEVAALRARVDSSTYFNEWRVTSIGADPDQNAIIGTLGNVERMRFENNRMQLGSLFLQYDLADVTIVSGVATVTRTRNRIATEASAASDDLDTITGTGAESGARVVLTSFADNRDVVVKHGTGNINTADGKDVTLGVTTDIIELEYNGSNWNEVGIRMASETLIVKAADESVTSSTTYQDDDDFTFAIAANAKASFEIELVLTSPGAADIKFQLSVPASAEYSFTLTEPDSVTLQAVNDTGTGLVNTNGATQHMRIVGSVVNSSTAGNVTLQWAQNTSNGTPATIYAGSFMKHKTQ